MSSIEVRSPLLWQITRGADVLTWAGPFCIIIFCFRNSWDCKTGIRLIIQKSKKYGGGSVMGNTDFEETLPNAWCSIKGNRLDVQIGSDSENQRKILKHKSRTPRKKWVGKWPMVPWSIKGEKEQPQSNTGNSQQVSQMSRAGLEWHYAPRTAQPHRCISFRPRG